MMYRFLAYASIISICFFGNVGCEEKSGEETNPLLPKIASEWWQVAGNPDLGEYTSPKQQPVDFGAWQAADGTWQLWSCIRHTKCGGHTRLFHRWEGKSITDANWSPMGIAMQADPGFGEEPGGMQAPHVINIFGEYFMFYGDWGGICKAKSFDGKTFARMLQADGKSRMFTEGVEANARDAMVIRVSGVYYCYYTAHPNKTGAVYCRVSHDMNEWSDAYKVAYGGQAGTKFWNAECPHVVERDGFYYLFRTQRYHKNPKTTVYRSPDPLDFGINDDRYRLGTLPVAAPEIVFHEGKCYIAALNTALDGIRIAELAWPARK